MDEVASIKGNEDQMTKKESVLAEGLLLRPVQWADRDAVAKLIYDVCEADGDTTVAVTPEELEHEWKNERFKLETDAFLVETKDGRVVGYEEFSNRHEHYDLNIDGRLARPVSRRGCPSKCPH